MNKQALIERLEKTVVERTPYYDDIAGRVRYNEGLMKTHYLLAKIYLQECHTLKARTCLKGAEHQLFCFNETLQQKVEPINMKKEKGSKCSPYVLEKVLERTRKRKEEGEKFYHWAKKIFELGDRLQ